MECDGSAAYLSYILVELIRRDGGSFSWMNWKRIVATWAGLDRREVPLEQ